MKIFKFTSEDVWPLINILNEVCNGIYIDDFEKSIGVEEEVAAQFLARVNQEFKINKPSIEFNASEAQILKKSFNEVLQHLGKWEFQTRIGVTEQELHSILEKFK